MNPGWEIFHSHTSPTSMIIQLRLDRQILWWLFKLHIRF